MCSFWRCLVSTQKLRDQLRCFEIYKAQTVDLSKRIASTEHQTEIALKRFHRLEREKKQKQLAVEQLDADLISLEEERDALQSELADLESEQESIDRNERRYVERLKEQLSRLGKGMEQKVFLIDWLTLNRLTFNEFMNWNAIESVLL